MHRVLWVNFVNENVLLECSVPVVCMNAAANLKARSVVILRQEDAFAKVAGTVYIYFTLFTLHEVISLIFLWKTSYYTLISHFENWMCYILTVSMWCCIILIFSLTNINFISKMNHIEMIIFVCFDFSSIIDINVKYKGILYFQNLDNNYD